MIPAAASFPGGHSSLSRFIYQQFVQPDAAPDSSFCKSGKIKFVIGKDGLPGNFTIEENLGYHCDEEIIRILKLTRWKPAVFNGKKVDDIKLLPVTIMFEKSEPVNSDMSPQSAPACPSQMLLAKYE